MDNGVMPAWLQALLVMIPAILAPFIAWFLSQRGVGRQSREFEWLLRRTELVERLRKLLGSRDTANVRYEAALNAEVDDIIGDLSALREPEREEERLARTIELKRLPRWRSFLLLYKQASLIASIYRGLFYFFIFLGVASSSYQINEIQVMSRNKSRLTVILKDSNLSLKELERSRDEEAEEYKAIIDSIDASGGLEFRTGPSREGGRWSSAKERAVEMYEDLTGEHGSIAKMIDRSNQRIESLERELGWIENRKKTSRITVIVSTVIYIGIALLFRAAAVRQHKRKRMKSLMEQGAGA